MSEPYRIVCASDNWDPEWRWISEDPSCASYDWTFFDATAKGWLERLVTRPNLTRYRVALRAVGFAKRAEASLLVSHQPRVTMLTSIARKARRSPVPHIAFTFNFTDLPGRTQRRLMCWAFRDVEKFFAFSSYECDLYSQVFSIPRERFQMLHLGFDLPIASIEVGRPRPDRYVCAVGGEGRDYHTLVDAMRSLPHIQLEIVARPHNVQNLVEIPSNVTIRTNVGVQDTHAIMRSSEFTVLPLAHDRVPCGHVTIVTSMHMGKAQIVTDSAGVNDYVEDGRTALLVRHGDSGDLARKIERLWNDAEERRRLGCNGREFAAEHCTNSSVASVLAEYVTTRNAQ